MKILTDLKYLLIGIQYRLKVTSVQNILWLINLTPKWAGFSILQEKNSVAFWVVHFILMFYVFFLSNVVLQIKFSKDTGDIIKANTILSLIILTLCSDYWFLKKRAQLISTLDKLKAVDLMAQQNQDLLEKYTKLLNGIKRLIFVYYAVNFFNTMIIYMPQRIQFSSVFSTSNQCTGIDVTSEISRHICRVIAVSQDLSIIVVVLNYQALLLFIIAHTTCMYSMLSEEMKSLRNIREQDLDLLKERLSIIIKRHGLLIEIVKNIKYLYNTPIGINFGTNMYSICLYFSLPMEEWISFAPLLGYYVLMFFLYCFFCQKLIDASIAFEKSVYDCGWEKYAIKDKKTIYIVLKVAQKPVILLAADMVPVNIYTFATAVQFMFKLVTVLKF